ncbi:cation:proton antiporter [Ramlibacter sp. AN1133]|uniref:cation:proton antiporter n=1 Tax=Ramlibacter sp. AN1133 TaxID=3133429 RepID=UPI0030BAD21C
MSLAEWALFVGGLMVTMVLAGTLLGRLPLSSAMVYLALGWVLGPDVMNVLRPDPFLHARLLETIAEIALLISLFAVGMQLGVPLRDRRWLLPARLAIGSMALLVGMVTAVGVWLLHLPLGAAILLGAIVAPTDPVLASGVRSEPGARPDRMGFSLAGEGGLNDGTAFPFVMLGLGLLGLGELGPGLMRWWGISLLWATLGGVAIGALLGTGAGRLVVLLRSRHGQAVGLDEFLGLGLIGMAYGLAQICLASGFLAVFAAGLALQRVRERPQAPRAEQEDTPRQARDMQDTVQAFNEQLEKVAELALVLMLGAMLSYAPLPAAGWWFVPLLLLVLRPLSVLAAVPGEGLSRPQRTMIAWFGIRGIGSVFYLLFALRHGIAPRIAETLVSLTLWTVATSIIVHGITAQPLMDRYILWRRRAGRRR